jgi:peptidyl-prolyl cis-trans isomerase A (cyclophilin A)
MPFLSRALLAAFAGSIVLAGCATAEPRASDGSLLPAPLANPNLETATAPDVFQVKFDTSKGAFTVKVTRAWAPNGADRFYNLVKIGFFDGTRFFRVISGFMAQFGISGEPAVTAKWHDATIPDDPVTQSNTRSFVTFATAGPNTRTTQIFINFGDNKQLDGSGFSPFGQVVDGMSVVDALDAEYGEGAPNGNGPAQSRIESDGNAYLTKDFPNLDFVKTATLL